MTGQIERSTKKEQPSRSKARGWNSPKGQSNVGTLEAEPSWTHWQTQASEAEPSWATWPNQRVKGAIAETHDCRSEPTWEGEPVQESTGDTLRQSLRAHHGKPRPERQSLRGRLGKPWRHVGRWATSEHQRQSLRGHLAKPRPQRQSLRGHLGKPWRHFGR